MSQGKELNRRFLIGSSRKDLECYSIQTEKNQRQEAKQKCSTQEN